MHQGLFHAIIIIILLCTTKCSMSEGLHATHSMVYCVQCHTTCVTPFPPNLNIYVGYFSVYPLIGYHFCCSNIFKMLSSWLKWEVTYIHKLVVILTSTLSNMCLPQGDNFLPSTWEIHRQTCGCLFSCNHIDK